MAHKDICIKFEREGRRFEAVGFLEEGEPAVYSDDIIRRTDLDGNVLKSSEDYDFLCCATGKFPQELSSYHLFTMIRLLGNPEPKYLCFSPYNNTWLDGWMPLWRWFGADFLVLRRRA